MLEDGALKRAETIDEIDQAVNFNIPVGAEHSFYTEFADVRGDFEEKELYRALNVDRHGCYDHHLQAVNKSLVFLGGMRGSGKTTELRKIAQRLHRPQCFFVVTCDVDQELNMSNIEYVDILIFQMEKLLEKAKDLNIELSEGVLDRMHNWMGERVKEVEDRSELSMGIEAGAKASSPSWVSLLKVFTAFKANIMAASSRTDTVRMVLKNRFDRLSEEVNLFLGEVTLELRERGIAQDILFIVDGLEKTMTADERRKVLIDESNYLVLIKVNTIYTLPIELMKEREILKRFSTVLSFPFVKLIEKDGTRVERAFERFREFISKRIDTDLFSSQQVIDEAIEFSGGSPRELLRIIERAAWYASGSEKVTLIFMKKSISKLANEVAQYIPEPYWDKIYEVARNNRSNKLTRYDDKVEYLLEKLALMEYNDGNYKRVNPLVVASDMYQSYKPDELG